MGSAEPTTERIASANAMSVAAGTAQPSRLSVPRLTVTKIRAGTATPQQAATTGTAASAGPPQGPDQQLALELEPGDEEEERERSVGRPVLGVERADVPVQEDA